MVLDKLVIGFPLGVWIVCAAIALGSVPFAHEFFVKILWLGTTWPIGVGNPITAGIGGMDFVNDRQLAFDQSHFVFGIYQNETGLGSYLLSISKESHGRFLNFQPQLRWQNASL